MSTLIEQLGQLGFAAALLDPERRVIASTETLTRLLGVTASALHSADITEAIACESKPLGGGPGKIYEISRDGILHKLRLDLKQGESGFLALLIDVGREHSWLEDIRKFHAVRDRLLLDGKIGTWCYDPDAEMYYFSSEIALGHDRATAPVPVALLQTIQHPDDREKDTAIRERITREGGYANAEMRYRESDGSWTHLNVHYRAGRQMPSGRYEILGVSQNITAIASARDEARQVSQRLTLALKAAHAGVFEYDYRTKTFWASPELTELVGVDIAEQAGREWYLLFVEEDREPAQTFFRGARNAIRENTVEVRLIHAGGYRWVKFYFDVQDWDADGMPLLGVGLLIDIDERKRQEIALAEARRAADFANRSKTEFLATMSHELRTPLNAILGFSEMIQSQMFGAIGAKYVEYARDIHASGEHLLALINDILDLAKLEAGKLELRESEIALPALVKDCLTLVRGRAEAGRILLDSELSPVVPHFRGDARAVRQVLLNFLSNAVKFTPEGGKVIIRTGVDANGDIIVSVSDTGIGMNESEVKVALAPFGQIDSTMARKCEGTGLGLPICKSLMELHGGELVVASKPREGTTLTARFPASRAVRAAASA